jgi:hypothetical protein
MFAVVEESKRTASAAYSSGVRKCGTPEAFVGTIPSAPVRAFRRSWYPRTPFHCRASPRLVHYARGRIRNPPHDRDPEIRIAIRPPKTV